ncbi:hypothetical protein [Tranquillimonas rosea]|uniref:hypothetical protein n=1 Tax=Tranquillimonas rosea TaxID=641238 RepID=UPI003BADBC66
MPKTKDAGDVRVEMTAAHTYRTSATSHRTLPAGWRGTVPAEIGREIEKAKRGAVIKPQPKDAPKPQPKDAPTSRPQEPRKPKPQASLSPEERLAQFRAAVATLGEEAFTDEGSPSVEAVNGALPADAAPVTADERDALWAEVSGSAIDEVRLAQFRAALSSLGEADLTEEGRPAVDAVNAALPAGAAPVTAEERDALWAHLEALVESDG